MWILLVGLAAAEEPAPDWAVPTHFPEVHERGPDEAPVVVESPLPEPHPRRKRVGHAALIALMIAGGWVSLGYGVAGAHAALDF